MKYYHNIFVKYLVGKELNEKTIEYVVNHENKWLRNVFRHYIQSLFLKRRITAETFAWIVEVVPSRSYKMDVRPYPIDMNEVKKTLEFFKQNHKLYYALYRLVLESGMRIIHAIKLFRTWNPEEKIEIPNVGLETKRVVEFPEQGFARYYFGLGEGTKRCDWVYMSVETANTLKEIGKISIAQAPVWKYSARHGLIRSKLMRKVAWRLMIKAMEREVAKLDQSRFGEISVSEARYEDLLTEADQAYPNYLKLLKEEFREALS